MTQKQKNSETAEPKDQTTETAEAAETAAEAAGGEEAPGGGEGAGAQPSSEELKLMLEDARAKADEQQNQLLRVQAELENTRKRAQRDIENAHKYALEKFILELLPIRDSMEMGIDAAREQDVDPAKLKEGMELTLKMLSTAMDKFGIAEIDPQGEKFNPDLHQAMSMQEAPDKEPNTVLTVVQKGYQLNDRLVRPALVIVSSGGSKGDAPGTGGEAGGHIDEQA